MRSFPRRFTVSPDKKCEVTLPLWPRRSNQVNTFNCPPVNFAYDRRACWQDERPGKDDLQLPPADHNIVLNNWEDWLSGHGELIPSKEFRSSCVARDALR